MHDNHTTAQCNIVLTTKCCSITHAALIHGGNVTEISIATFIQNHNNENDVASNFNETHSNTLLVVTTSFHLCELEGIIETFPSGPNNAI